MKFELRIGDHASIVEVLRDAAGALRFQIDGRAVSPDAVALGPDFFSVLLDGQSFEVRVQAVEEGLLVRCAGREFPIRIRDPRAWRGAQGAALAAQGRQQIAAPMPGKVVRVLVVAGQAVEAGQGLAVVEAMKMQNEIRAPKSGTVERIFVEEDQTVAAGQPLAVIS